MKLLAREIAPLKKVAGPWWRGCYGEGGGDAKGPSSLPGEGEDQTEGGVILFRENSGNSLGREVVLSEDVPAFRKDGAEASSVLEHISASDESLLSDLCTKCWALAIR